MKFLIIFFALFLALVGFTNATVCARNNDTKALVNFVNGKAVIKANRDAGSGYSFYDKKSTLYCTLLVFFFHFQDKDIPTYMMANAEDNSLWIEKCLFNNAKRNAIVTRDWCPYAYNMNCSEVEIFLKNWQRKTLNLLCIVWKFCAN